MNGFGPTSLGVWIHSFLCFSRHVVWKGERPWLRQVCLWPLVEVEPRAPSQCASTWRPKLPSAQTAIFCPAHFQSCNFEQLASSPSSTVHMGSQAGKAYRIVLEEHGACYSVLALLLAFVSPSRKRKGDESPSEKLRRLSSPRHWDVALVPFPEDFVPLPTPTETGLACPAPWAFPPSLCVLEPRATKLRVLAIAEAGDTVTADHLLQMACLAAEHKPTVLGIPGQLLIPYQLECTVVLLQSLHALFQLLTSGNTMQYCPQAASFAVALGTAARQDNGHIVSMAASLALALRAGRSTLAVAGVFGAGKTRSLTFLLAWLALTTHLKIAVVHKENPADRAITKLLTAFDLEPDHQRYFIRPVSREEAKTNTACTDYDLRASEAASYIPGCHVVIVTTGLVWGQIFFHEYGRRVGMVPRSSLKEGKNSQMVEKRTKTPKPNQHQQTPQARRPNLHHLVVFPLHWVKRVKQKLMAIKGLNSRKTRTTAQVCRQGKSPRRLQTDYPSRILVTSSHTTVRQNKVTLQVGCLAMLKRR